MHSVRFVNFRSISDTGTVKLKPVNFLVGANSSGKSTFLRFFPLLKQSLEKKTKGPLLWYGRLVDYGSFRDCLKHGESKMRLEFSFDLPQGYTRGFTRLPSGGGFTVGIEMKQSENAQFERIDRISIKWLDLSAELFLSIEGRVDSLMINEKEEKFDLHTFSMLTGSGIFPELIGRTSERTAFQLLSTQYLSYGWNRLPLIKNLLLQFSHDIKLFDSRTTNRKRIEILPRIALDSTDRMRDRISSVGKSNGNRGLEKAAWSISAEAVEKLRRIIFTSILPDLLAYANLQMGSDGASVRYIAPLRASFERYYRLQNVATDVVDSDGANLAMYLNGFSDSELRDFNVYLGRSFGFRLEVEEKGGHVSLRAKRNGGNNSVNLADVGFGVSQMLPVLVQIWDALRQNRNKNKAGPVSLLIAIEQPELHLHPKYQAAFARLIMDLVSDPNNSSVRLLIETHSETILNSIGVGISKNSDLSELFQVLVFDYNEGDSCSVRVSTYDDKGYLRDWPIGFFDA